jgi:hypothetical protein
VFVRARTHVVNGYVDAKTRQRVLRPAHEHYCVIDEIAGIAAGSPAEPRLLARRRRRRT